MSHWVDLAIVLAALLANAVYSGGETAYYTVSRVRIEMEARQGSRSAQLVRRLLASDTALVSVFVLGVTLSVELITYRAEHVFSVLGLSDLVGRLLLALVLTPIVFFFGDLLPKDLCRRRPHFFLSFAAPFLVLSRWAFWPLERLLSLLSRALMRVLRLEPRLLAAVRGREAVLGFLRESAQSGVLPAHAEQIARNVLKLRSIEVERAMVPWKQVETLPAGAGQAELYARVSRSARTRLPVVGKKGEVLGYVHQLDVLGEGPEVPVLDHLRDLQALPAHTPVDRALARLRATGQRLAIVGTRAAPRGLLTLKDLVEEISGDLAGW